MATSQILLYTIAGLILLVSMRRWIFRARMKEYTSSQVANKLNDSSVVLLDVRTQDERNQGHIKGSLHIPINHLMEKIKILDKYRVKEIICYCHSGSRSRTAASMLQKHGFNAVNMKGGMIEWNSLNLKS